MRHFIFASTLFLIISICYSCQNQNKGVKKTIMAEVMQEIYEEVKTPFKYGVVFQHQDSTKLIDSPTIF